MTFLSDTWDESSTCECDIECVCIFECECIDCECEDCAKELVFDDNQSWE